MLHWCSACFDRTIAAALAAHEEQTNDWRKVALEQGDLRLRAEAREQRLREALTELSAAVSEWDDKQSKRLAIVREDNVWAAVRRLVALSAQPAAQAETPAAKEEP